MRLFFLNSGDMRWGHPIKTHISLSNIYLKKFQVRVLPSISISDCLLVKLDFSLWEALSTLCLKLIVPQLSSLLHPFVSNHVSLPICKQDNSTCNSWEKTMLKGQILVFLLSPSYKGQPLFNPGSPQCSFEVSVFASKYIGI